MSSPIVVGVSGISGSGKTTLVNALSQQLHATCLFWDNFDEISASPSDYVTWFERHGDYNEFNYQALAEAIFALKKGQSITHPVNKEVLSPTQYIIVDAPLGKAHIQTSQHIDFFIHIDIPLDVALARRLRRDINHQNLSRQDIDNALKYYLTQSRPLFTEECMCSISNSADYIIDGSEKTETQVKLIVAYLNSSIVNKKQNATIRMVDEIDDKTAEHMEKDLVKYESENNIDVNYKKFSLVLSVEDNIVVGVLKAFTAFSEIYIDDLWVDGSYRRQGYGRMLLNELENRFKGKGFNNINLVTNAFNSPEFYKKCGFKAEFIRFNEKNPKLTKTFFVKFFGEDIQIQGTTTKKSVQTK